MENHTHEHNHTNCNSLCCGSWHKYHILRWLLGIFILIITFTIGYKLGELKGFFSNDGFGRMHGYNKLGTKTGYFGRNSCLGMMSGKNVFYNEEIGGTRAFPPMMYWQQEPATTTPKK